MANTDEKYSYETRVANRLCTHCYGDQLAVAAAYRLTKQARRQGGKTMRWHYACPGCIERLGIKPLGRPFAPNYRCAVCGGPHASSIHASSIGSGSGALRPGWETTAAGQ